MSRRYRGTILCEDLETERVVRPILERMYGRGQFRVERPPHPKNDGAADAWVRTQYVRLVAIARQLHKEAWGLVVVVDGDGFGREKRERSLDEGLTQAGSTKRGPDEKIVIFVPSRSIETWEYWLSGERAVDEQTPYKDHPDFRRAVREGHVSPRRAVEGWFSRRSATDAEEEARRLPALTAARRDLAERLR